MQMSSNARGETRAFSFLHVPIPTALRTSLSSSSLLTSSQRREALNVETFMHQECMYIWRPLMYLALWTMEAPNKQVHNMTLDIAVDDSGAM
ncbi:hypothetical protein BAE44_0004830 [Dichanthelium oligosanthes]|uniref:Uncharacterized protein n=1 Tax=Dichanthelium oligosanthes TaxID=888268 RepID=A0A1E5W9R3_9POAL|nr:hypothetical protein BAE44_0004830 [Dichanthelium oligosanthes]